MKDWTMMMKPILKIIQAVIKVPTVKMRKISSQPREKTKMKETKVRIDQEKEKCQLLLQQDFFAKETNFKII